MNTQTMVQEAGAVRSSLMEAMGDLTLAMENDMQAREAARNAKQNYEDGELEVAADALVNATGKNAETRKAEVDLILVRARQQGGALFALWHNSLNATYAAQDTSMALEQAKARFTAVKHATDLTAAMLNAMAAK